MAKEKFETSAKDKGADNRCPVSNLIPNDLDNLNYLRGCAQKDSKYKYTKTGNKEVMHLKDARLEISDDNKAVFKYKDGRFLAVELKDGVVSKFTDYDGTKWQKTTDSKWLSNKGEKFNGTIKWNGVNIFMKSDTDFSRIFDTSLGTVRPYSPELPFQDSLQNGGFSDHLMWEVMSLDTNGDRLLDSKELDTGRSQILGAKDYQALAAIKDNFKGLSQ